MVNVMTSERLVCFSVLVLLYNLSEEVRFVRESSFHLWYDCSCTSLLLMDHGGESASTRPEIVQTIGPRIIEA